MKFVIVPDLHYLQNNHSSTDDEYVVRGDGPPTQPTGYQARLNLLVDKLQSENLDFFISNGDIVHDNPNALQTVKTKYNEVGVPYYVSYGNHDRATEQEWVDVWGYGRNTDFEFGDYAFVLPNTSDESGGRNPADHEWLEERLDHYSNKAGVLVVMHVPQSSRWRNSPDAHKVRKVLKESNNLIGTVFSHVHGAITTERIDDLIFSMTGHFAHYGRNFYSYRRFEIVGNNIYTELYDVTNDRVIDRHRIAKEGNAFAWYHQPVLNYDFVTHHIFENPV